jgi:heat shock protein HslJ
MNKIFLCILVAVISFQCKSSKQPTVSQATLLNTYWKLADVNGNPVVTPDNSREAHIILTSEGGESKLKGFAGCNSLAGSFTLEKEKLKFLAITTKMMCDPERMKVEDYLLNALNTADSYSIEGETLELLVGDTSIADFKAVYLN